MIRIRHKHHRTQPHQRTNTNDSPEPPTPPLPWERDPYRISRELQEYLASMARSRKVMLEQQRELLCQARTDLAVAKLFAKRDKDGDHQESVRHWTEVCAHRSLFLSFWATTGTRPPKNGVGLGYLGRLARHRLRVPVRSAWPCEGRVRRQDGTHRCAT